MSGRRGVALLFALVLLLVLTALAHASLVTARTHRRIGGLAGSVAARLSEASAMAVAAARGMDTLPTVEWFGTVAGPPGALGLLSVRRLSPEVASLTAVFDSSGVRREAGALLWALDPGTRVAVLPRALEVGRALGFGAPEVLDQALDPLCLSAIPEGFGPWPLVRLTPFGLPGFDDPLALGRLMREELLARLDALGSPTGTPAPLVVDGLCVPSLWNWGAPSDAGSPCSARSVGVAATGDLVLAGGEGQGVLAVSGDLTLTGTRLEGLVLVGGDLILDDSAEIEGVVRVGGGVRGSSGSAVRAGGCAALSALAAVPALRAALVLPGAGWSRR